MGVGDERRIMNIAEKAIQNNEMVQLLEGKDGYHLEKDSWASISAPIDWTIVVPMIYQAYEKTRDDDIRKMFEKMDGNEADPSMVSDLLASLEIHYDDLKTARMNRRARDVLMVMLEYEHESFVDDLIPKILELDAWIEDDDNASKIYKKYGGHDLETDLLMGLVFYKTGALDKAESLLKKFMTYPEFVEVAPYLSDIDEFYEAYDDYNSEDFMDDEYDYDDDDYDEDDYDEEDDDFDLADHDDFMSFDDEDDEYTFYDLWDQYADLFTENEAFFEWVGRHL